MIVVPKMFLTIEPEVAGELGANTIMDTSIHPPVVSRLHYEFSGWLGDELLESFPCFIVSSRLRSVIEKFATSGFEFDSVEVSTSEIFQEICPEQELPKFWWLKIIGKPNADDFGISKENHLLVVSEIVYEQMKRICKLDYCEVVNQ